MSGPIKPDKFDKTELYRGFEIRVHTAALEGRQEPFDKLVCVGSSESDYITNHNLKELQGRRFNPILDLEGNVSGHPIVGSHCIVDNEPVAGHPYRKSEEISEEELIDRIIDSFKRGIDYLWEHRPESWIRIGENH